MKLAWIIFTLLAAIWVAISIVLGVSVNNDKGQAMPMDGLLWYGWMLFGAIGLGVLALAIKFL